MSDDLSKAVLPYDQYVAELFAEEDEVLVATRAAIAREGLPEIAVSATGGKLLMMLARLVGASRILELGTLGGYSAIWLARALPANGKLVSLELDAHHADVSRRNIQAAGFADVVEVRVGPASETLDAMLAASEEPFDLVFIDANKDGYPEYLEKSLPLLRPGGLLLGDNALRIVGAADGAGSPIDTFNRAAAAHPDLVATIIPNLGKGLDGLLIAIKGSRSGS
jgi:predicted O-methyltransferase YrrM